MSLKPLPVGVDDFKDLILNNYYYVDKTLFIKDLLDLKGKVNLFTRPRRFGKTLGISTVQYYFENTGDVEGNKENRSLFNGLQIMAQGERYTREMNRYPVISLSLKSSKQPDWELSYGCLIEEIGREYLRHCNIIESLQTEEQRRRYYDIMNSRGSRQDYVTSVRFLSDCLYRYWNQKVIILIDEYDVPLENSYFAGFYEKMIDFIRSVFESAFKTNPGLEFAVVTGCLRISRESIFTGLNNLEMISIMNHSYSGFFGFVQEEIDDMLRYYGLMEKREKIKDWYNGYLFGDSLVYNPWSVTNYVKALTVAPDEMPAPYWANTSSNNIVKGLVERADLSVKGELEVLLGGGSIEKPVHEDITYDTVYDSDENLWNFLFFTGYLKQISRSMNQVTQYVIMALPNREVEYIYRTSIVKWFRDEIKERDLSSMYQAMQNGDAVLFENELLKLLKISISYMDTKEAFYHGFMLGILANMKDYLVKSNREGGSGRSDIVIRSLNVCQAPMVVELKVSDTYKGMEAACDKALAQIREKEYASWLPEEGYTEVLNYGISFYRKQCKIKVERQVLSFY